MEQIVKALPQTDRPLIVRTDFSDEEGWETVLAAVLAPQGGSGGETFVYVVNDEAYDGLTTQELLGLVPVDAERDDGVLFVVDKISLGARWHPVLVVGLGESDGTFRSVPLEIFSIASNLDVGNLTVDEFIEGLDDDGVYHGL